MITLNQVLLLQEKVESAVAKIEQLKAENDALRSKCAELTNALSAKTEQFSAFEADQSRIERGILQALERLNAVENGVLGAAVMQAAGEQTAVSVNTTSAISAAPVSPQPVEEAPAEATQIQEQPSVTEQEPAVDFDEPAVTEEPAINDETVTIEEPSAPDMQPFAIPEIEEEGAAQEESGDAPDMFQNDSSQQGQFDIF